MRRPIWVLATYAIILILGILMALPNFLTDRTRASLPAFLSANSVSLGLDLQGGAHLLLAVDRADLARTATRELSDSLRDLLRAGGADPRTLQRDGSDFILPDTPGTAAALESLAAAYRRPGEPPRLTVDRSGGQIRIGLGSAALDRMASDAATKSLEVIRHRIDEIGVSEPRVSRVGEDRILVQLPGVDDPGHLRQLLGSTAQMSFHLVDEGATTARPGYSLLPLRGGGRLAVADRVALRGDHLKSAAAGFDQQTGQPAVTFSLDAAGARTFGEITAANVGRQFAIILDGQVLTAPVIRQAIMGGKGQITGDFTTGETQTLAVILNSGALPASFEVIEERTVGASLGADSIRSGLVTGLVGLALVVATMVGLYGPWGLLASAVLGLNVALTLALLGLLGATLTLPGIAGIILCLGIAVDANILIFSRIREETAGGARAALALTRGYDKAWSTILDANVTTLLAMLLLFLLGAGAIRGFAVTMSIGILVSMFTAITLMRIVMEGWVRRRRLARLEIPPLVGRVPAPGSRSFLRHGRAALTLSALLTALSLAAIVWPGPRWGVDFTGGVQMAVTATKAIPLAGLRAALGDFGDVTLQTFGAPTEVLLRLQGEATQATVGALEAAVRTVVSDAAFARIDLVGPTVSGELAWIGAMALAAAVLAMLAYIWLRFEWRFAASAIVVLALDVTKTLGVIMLTGWEFNLTTVVALLTLIGYSVNDKVVVYDRVREAMRADASGDLRSLIDRSLNQVLARCVFTSGTTLAALIPMAIWGGPAVSDFARPMIAGVIIATTSSLFVAGPLLAWLERRNAGVPVMT
ncbi:protein translocase subunit SecD [Oceanibacterium hippocampi]|uniref:Multifunctional fusion protein n=1 Tax=Oceanibacterium hippocampi TaxID=745714 RepID=A0A1Y5TY02_9PROT|nr:protein translocase subunit SecD [Oceanibacterium hippocampi]SLN76605.1 bifunctional preprotein translocase subunit SecD/SecF [Oceanibacterium hippocampi]